MATDQVMKELHEGMKKLNTAYAKAVAVRQKLVITALLLRKNGYVLASAPVAAFDRTRGAIERAAADLDVVLGTMKSEQPEAWGEITASMNYQLSKIPGTRLSSTSVLEIVQTGLPAFPRVLLAPRGSPAAQQATQIELAEAAGYNVSLGFLPALTSIGPACAAGLAAAAPTGVGAVAVGVGCALLGAAVVVGSLYLVYKAASQLPRLVQSFSPTAAASLAEAERLEAAAKYLKAANDAKVDPKVVEKIAQETSAQPKSDSVPWAFLLVAGIAAVYFLRKPEIQARFPAFR